MIPQCTFTITKLKLNTIYNNKTIYQTYISNIRSTAVSFVKLTDLLGRNVASTEEPKAQSIRHPDDIAPAKCDFSVKIREPWCTRASRATRPREYTNTRGRNASSKEPNYMHVCVISSYYELRDKRADGISFEKATKHGEFFDD